MEKFFDWIIPILQDVGLKLLISIAIFIVCRLIIKAVVKALRTGKAAQKMEPTVAHFLANFVNIVLYIILAVTIIAIMGVPMASVVAAIASAGVAIGLALQGALSNFAGGIMILLFHPFQAVYGQGRLFRARRRRHSVYGAKAAKNVGRRKNALRRDCPSLGDAPLRERFQDGFAVVQIRHARNGLFELDEPVYSLWEY